MSIGKRIRELREGQGLFQEELARRANIATNTLSRIELGYHDPSAATIVRLAQGLNVKPGVLFEVPLDPAPLVEERRILFNSWADALDKHNSMIAHYWNDLQDLPKPLSPELWGRGKEVLEHLFNAANVDLDAMEKTGVADLLVRTITAIYRGEDLPPDERQAALALNTQVQGFVSQVATLVRRWVLREDEATELGTLKKRAAEWEANRGLPRKRQVFKVAA
jgi:transcriptional regulator with XRE-family HTH domain